MQITILFVIMSILVLARAFRPNMVAKSARFLSLRGGALPADEEMRAFYALGVNVARQVGGELKGILTKDEIAVMLDGFTASMTDSVEGSEQEMLMKYGQTLNTILTDRANSRVGNEKKAGEEYAASFMLNNLSAVKTNSGLVYLETLAGTGATPTAASTVLVHYHGTLSDGTVFDSSKDRGEPIKFPIANVIKAWQEGVQMMKVGGKATLVCPPEIAYGDSGSPPVIPPGATLVFEVELLEVF